MSITAAAPTSTSLGRARVRWPRVLRSEWIKFRTMRSTYVLLAIALVLLIGIWVLVSATFFAEEFGGADGPFADATNLTAVAIAGSVGLVQLFFGILGAMAVTSEYSSGSIRSTLTAVPGRTSVLVAKAVVLFLASTILSLIAIGIALVISDALIPELTIDMQLQDPEILRALIAAAIYLGGVAVFGSVCGWVARGPIGGITAAVALFPVVPFIFGSIPVQWMNVVSDLLPSNFGQSMYAIGGIMEEMSDQLFPPTFVLSPYEGLGIFVAYALVFLAIAAFLLKRRDA